MEFSRQTAFATSIAITLMMLVSLIMMSVLSTVYLHILSCRHFIHNQDNFIALEKTLSLVENTFSVYRHCQSGCVEMQSKNRVKVMVIQTACNVIFYQIEIRLPVNYPSQWRLQSTYALPQKHEDCLLPYHGALGRLSIKML